MGDLALSNMAAAYCGQLKSFITCLHTNTTQLRASAAQKPPAYADLSSFLLDFGDRAAEDAAELEVLEEMTVENVSFQELLANCMELYKQNETSIEELEPQLEQYGYVREGESEKATEEKEMMEMTFVEDLKQRVRSKDPPRESSEKGSVESREEMAAMQFSDLLNSSSSSGRAQSQTESYRHSVSVGSVQSLTGATNSPLPPAVISTKLDMDDMSMLGESFSLEDFGLSASTLASLARLDPSTPDRYNSPADKKQHKSSDVGSGTAIESIYKAYSPSSTFTPSPKFTPSPGFLSRNNMPFLGLVSDEEYAQVFPWLQKRVSLKELNEAIVKINECMLIKQAGMLQCDSKHAKVLEVDDTVLLKLGSNMKACLLFLVQIDRLVMASSNGRTTYRPSELEKFR
ncbi:hypothetical protein MPTK1_6g19880 [Marchantia polymorpha subsp. ruderalis]|uniref:Spindle and kinetochore-associated protein 3 n=2 Tax=Marchantia polymorpha TaxID=3197 RepID=A0AAF6BTZ0_MARPO|nr:hypothetical protein MARPO_0045s0075 [Marchantia polymorpha]BBN15474.1 hypothetical protein Mp_6g19880 [Marchantia polymorpha subsp. ruderalis]|eukprot:PTQ39414.1 hypothetical protein MARPO_0045s0075 [Marchantia polymorpha]